MLQNSCKTLGFKKNLVYEIPPEGGGGKPYPASGLIYLRCDTSIKYHTTTLFASVYKSILQFCFNFDF